MSRVLAQHAPSSRTPRPAPTSTARVTRERAQVGLKGGAARPVGSAQNAVSLSRRTEVARWGMDQSGMWVAVDALGVPVQGGKRHRTLADASRSRPTPSTVVLSDHLRASPHERLRRAWDEAQDAHRRERPLAERVADARRALGMGQQADDGVRARAAAVRQALGLPSR